MVKEIRYKGQIINLKDIELIWSDCFGDQHTGDIEDYASDYAAEEVAIALAGEGW